MYSITIDNNTYEVREEMTILAAAKMANIDIPTLCYLGKLEFFTSCMVCLVKDCKTGKFLPACSSPVYNGMVIETNSEPVRTARREALQLILSEHIGDCEAPCRQICPAFMNIPKMIRQIREGCLKAALLTVKEHIAFPGILGRICHAPCEKGCRKRLHDEAVSICLLKRYVADTDLSSGNPYVPQCDAATGRKVAIVGAGPTGLSAAYYLLQAGVACTVYEREHQPGGKLLTEVLFKQGLESLLTRELQPIIEMGCDFKFNHAIGRDEETTVDDLTKLFDAVIVAVGKVDPDRDAYSYGVEMAEKGVKVEYQSFETNIRGVFAGGDALMPLQQTVRAVADGRSLAIDVTQYLRGEEKIGEIRGFNCRFGKLLDDDMAEFLKEVDTDAARNTKQRLDKSGLDETEAVDEAKRCLHCDCRKTTACKLREYATEYEAKQSRFRPDQRGVFRKNNQHERVVYEPGKCIKCGICVRISARYHDESGLTFHGRGIGTRITVPFDDPLSVGLRECADECVENCPTGALAWKTD